MKCKYCDGDGVIVDVEYGHAGKYGCKYCDGTGVVEPLTEQEYIQSCTTEQLAEWIYQERWTHSDGWYEQQGHTKAEVVEWLKQPKE